MFPNIGVVLCFVLIIGLYSNLLPCCGLFNSIFCYSLFKILIATSNTNFQQTILYQPRLFSSSKLRTIKSHNVKTAKISGYKTLFQACRSLVGFNPAVLITIIIICLAIFTNRLLPIEVFITQWIRHSLKRNFEHFIQPLNRLNG